MDRVENASGEMSVSLMVEANEADIPVLTVQLRAANAVNGKCSRPTKNNCNHMIFMV